MKPYATPLLVARGNAVAETQSGTSGAVETSGQSNRIEPSLVGGVGFFL